MFRVTDNPIVMASRVFATVLADLFLCLRAGDELESSITTKVIWQFARFENVGVVTLPLHRASHSRQEVYPVFRAEAVRGRPFPATCGGHRWSEILQTMYDRVCGDKWGQAKLNEHLLTTRTDFSDSSCSCHLRDDLASIPPQVKLDREWSRPQIVIAPPARERTASAVHWILLRAIRTMSGPRLQQVRYRIRRLLYRFSLTQPLAAWLRREKGSLSMGGFVSENEGHPGVVILADSRTQAVAHWRGIRTQSAFRRSRSGDRGTWWGDGNGAS